MRVHYLCMKLTVPQGVKEETKLKKNFSIKKFWNYTSQMYATRQNKQKKILADFAYLQN